MSAFITWTPKKCRMAIAPMEHDGIKRVAEAMVAVLGSSAVTEARKKAAEALDAGDVSAFRAWHLIMKAARSIWQQRCP